MRDNGGPCPPLALLGSALAEVFISPSGFVPWVVFAWVGVVAWVVVVVVGFSAAFVGLPDTALWIPLAAAAARRNSAADPVGADSAIPVAASPVAVDGAAPVAADPTAVDGAAPAAADPTAVD
jgi:hypothetical protein